MSKKQEKTIKKFTGVVVSDKMEKTVAVEISRLKKHPIYLKRYYADKKILADDPQSEYKIGDKVVIVETKPISNRKKFRVLSKVSDKKKK